MPENIARYITVSAKVPVDFKEKLKRYDIPVDSLIRETMEMEVRRRELEEVDEDMQQISEKLRKISDEEFARIIREARYLRAAACRARSYSTSEPSGHRVRDPTCFR